MLKLAITFVIVLASQRASADECRATAVLEGDGALVDSIDAALTRRGIATTVTADCPAATARIERRGTAVAVLVTDPNGRRSERTLADLDAAASLIESWARQDMNAAALIGWVEPAPVESRLDAKMIVPAAPRVRDPVSLAAAGETSFGFDGTSWLGARVSACVRVGPLCAGASARLLSDDPRRSYDVVAGADFPVALGSRVVAVAGAGIGAGWFQSVRSQGEVMTTVTNVGTRVDGHAALAVSLTRHVALYAGFSLGASPQAPAVIESGGDAPVTNGEPSGFIRGDIGLRIGAP
jgi:hypothetical protein